MGAPFFFKHRHPPPRLHLHLQLPLYPHTGSNGTPTTVSSDTSDNQHLYSDLQQQCIDNKDKINDNEMKELLTTLVERSLPAPEKPQTP